MCKTNYHIVLVIIAVMMTVLTLAGCSDKKHGPLRVERIDTEVDTLVFKARKTGDHQRVLALVDSLEKAGALSPLRINYYRGEGLRELGKDKEAMECYRKATEKALDNYDDLWCYQEAARHLTRILFNEQNYEEFVNTAIPLLSVLDSVESYDPEARIQIHAMLGMCNLKLKQPQQAKENFNIVYAGCQQWLAEDTTGRASFASFQNYDNIAGFYLDLEEFEETNKWLEREEALLPAYVAYNGENMKWLSDYYTARLKINQIETVWGLGNKEEAIRLYDEYKKLPGAEIDYNIFSEIALLMKMGRYAEAADKYAILDRFVQQSGMELSLNTIGIYFTKMEANLKAGRKDSVCYVAKQIVENIDSVITRQKESEAAKLATIYDTQGKERQIAEQQAELAHQRIIGLLVAIVLLIIFFVIYTLVRRRAAKRMAEMRAAQERIENELRIARDIQMSMVPSTFPDYEGLDMYASMTPAKEVGGDLYGYVLIGDKLYFALGDVSGKGVPASLFMAQATRLFRTLAAQKMMPAEICTHMNDALSGEDNKSSMFVTFWLGLVDLTTGHLDFCNAGHNPPVIGGGEHHGNFLDMQPNAPIGLWPGMEFVGEEIDSIKDRPLFIYTDGLNEAENCQQKQFGDDRLLDILRTMHFDSAQQVIDTLREEVERHRNGAEPNDDLTMMCIRISSNK